MQRYPSRAVRWVAALAIAATATAILLYRQRLGAPAGSAPRREPPSWVRKLRTSGAQRPNILLVVYDARRRDDFSLGRFGNGRHDTPFLEDFSRSAVFFENAVAPGCWTIPVHAAIFSGLTVCQLGIDRYNAGAPGFATHFLSLAEILSLGGYRTIAWADHPFFYNEAREVSLLRGFEQFSVVQDFQRYGTFTNVGTRDGSVELRYPLLGMGPLSPAQVDQAILRYNRGERPDPAAQADFDTVSGLLFPRLAELFGRSEYFQRRYGLDFDRHLFSSPDETRPFLFFLNLHMSFVAEPDPGLYHEFFLETLLLNAAGRNARLEPDASRVGVANCLVRNYERLGLPKGVFANPWQLVKQAFDNRFYDAAFEAVWRYLERRGQTRNSVTIVTSDHGVSFGEHGEPLFLHDGARPYEYLTRVPLVIRFPEGSELASRHGRRAEKVSLVDLFPTIVELALGPNVFERDLPVMGRSLVRRIDRGDFEPVLFAESSLLPTLAHDWSEVAGYAKAVYWGDYKLLAAPDSYRRLGSAAWPTEVRLGQHWPLASPSPHYARLDRPLTLLYRLTDDPHERRNLAAERPEIVERLERLFGASWSCEPLRASDQAPRWHGDAQETLRALGYVQ